jgi:hypothetical protein
VERHIYPMTVISSSCQRQCEFLPHDHSVEGDLANANSAQTVLYFFLLMLYKTSTCKIFWLCAVVFFHNLFIDDIFFLLFINLQVEHTLDKCYNEPKNKLQKENIIVIFICYAVGLLQYSKCLIKSRNSHCLYRYQVTLILLD